MRPSKKQIERAETHKRRYGERLQALESWNSHGIKILAERYRRDVVIVNNYQNGESLASIADTLRISNVHVSKILDEYGIEKRPSGNPKWVKKGQ